VLLKLEFLIVWALKNITVEGKEKALLKDIRYGNWLGRQEELIVRAARELQKSVVKLLYSAE